MGASVNMNRYKKGADVERAAVNQHIKNGAIFAGRMAGSKCKGKLKVDVVALYMFSSTAPGILILEQYKKGKSNYTKERKVFNRVQLPSSLDVVRKFIQVK